MPECAAVKLYAELRAIIASGGALSYLEPIPAPPQTRPKSGRLRARLQSARRVWEGAERLRRAFNRTIGADSPPEAVEPRRIRAGRVVSVYHAATGSEKG